MRNTKKGFTLVELLVVIAILAILATVSVVGYTSFIDRANQSTALQEMTQIRDSVIAEDILNPNFSISGGTITVADGTDPSYPNFNEYVKSLTDALGEGRSCDNLETGEAALVLKNTDKKVKATWTFADNTIETDKLGNDEPVAPPAGGGDEGGETSTPVTLSVPSGVTAVEMGEGNVLPTADAPANYTFAGWAEVAVAETTTAPTILAAGSIYSGTATTLYAVYTRIETVQPSSNFVKVTENKTDWSGSYLIVYESGKVAFNGGLSTLDAVSNTKRVTITNGTIAANSDNKAAAVTIAKSGTNYTIKSASGYYVGQTSDANGLKSNTSTTYANTISINNDGTVNIVSGGAYLRYNSASDQLRFRYYKSSSYTGQKAICLYKLSESAGSTSTIYTTNP